MRIRAMVAFGVFALLLAGISCHTAWAATELPNEKIIEIAKEKALAMGLNVNNMTVTCEKTYPEFLPKLAGRSFQAVTLRENGVRGGALWISVDRNTGEVIDTIQERD